LFQRVRYICSGVGEGDGVSTGRLRLDKKGREIRRAEWRMDCTHDLATQLLDALAGRRFEILAKLIVGGDEIPFLTAALEDCSGESVPQLPGVVGPVHSVGRARLAGQRCGSGAGANHHLVEIAGQRVDGESDRRVRYVDNHVDALV